MAATPVIVYATDLNGNVQSGAKLYSYAAGTTTPQAIYTDSGLGTPSSNPAVCDSSGRAVVWLDSSLGDYKLILKNSADSATYFSQDHIDASAITPMLLIYPARLGDQTLNTTDSPTFASVTLGVVPFSGVVADPGADRIMFWDDSDGQVEWLGLGTGLAITANTLSLDGDLEDISGLTPTDNGVIIGDGTAFTVESGATLRASLGLAIGSDVLAYDSNLQAFASAFSAPTADGAAGQYLKTDGAGTLTFATPAGAGDLLAAANETVTGDWDFQGDLTLGGVDVADISTAQAISNKTITGSVVDGVYYISAYSLPTDETADAGPAINSAITAAVAAGANRVKMPAIDRVYIIETPINLSAGNITLDLSGGTLRKGATISGTGDVAYAAGSWALTDANTLASNAVTGATSITLASGKGANMPAKGWALLASSASFPDGAALNSLGWWIYIISVSTDTVTIATPIPFDFNTADNAQIFVPTFVENVAIENGFVDNTGSTTSGNVFNFETCLMPRVGNVRCTNTIGQSFCYFEGCVGSVANVECEDQTGTSYVVVEAGPNVGGRFHVLATRCRHAYTTVNTKATATVPGYGVPTGSRITGTSLDSWKAGFDTHEDGWGIHFDVTVVGSESHGVQVRAPHSVIKAQADNTRGAGVYVVSGSGDKCVLEYVRTRNTNQGGTSSVDATDMSSWIDRGSITLHADDCHIVDYDIEACGGPGIQFLSGATFATIGGGRIYNPNQTGTTSTAAIDQEGATAATFVFTGAPVIESTDGNMDYVFAVDNASAIFMGSYYAAGAAVGQFDDGGSGATLGMERVQTTSRTTYNDLLHLDKTNKRVGIGTVSPLRQVHIYGGADNEPLRLESTDSYCLIETIDSGGSVNWGVVAGDAIIRIGSNNVYQYDLSGLVHYWRTNAGTLLFRASASGVQLDSGDYINGASGPRWIKGSGTPESAVSAPVGSFYSRTDGGTSTSFYVKESGTGSTGWVAK